MAYYGPTPLPLTAGGTGTTPVADLNIVDGVVYNTGSTLKTTAVGTAGQVLTSNGAGVAPSFQSVAGSVTTIAGDSGTATGSTITLNAHTNSGTSVTFSAASSTVSLHVTDSSQNTIIGNAAGNGTLSGSSNTSCGYFNLISLTSGHRNVATGDVVLASVTSGDDNSAFGSGAAGSVSTGTKNCAFGSAALGSTTGSSNIAIGFQAASNYTSTEHDNIIIGNTGTVGENNIIRIGNTAVQSKFFAAGVSGASVNGTAVVVNTNGQLGNGISTNTAQPAFFAYINSAPANVTGDGTAYTVALNTTLFDQASNFNTGTFTFTAPVTGIYHFDAGVLGQNLIAASTPTLQLVTTGQTYTLGNNAGAFAGNDQFTGSWTIKMTATNTATLVYTVGGGAKTVSVYGAAGDVRSFLSGFLVC